MTRVRMATLQCDADDGQCGEWEVDYYEATVSRVGGVPITSTARAPGWSTTDDGQDLCPEHSGGAA